MKWGLAFRTLFQRTSHSRNLLPSSIGSGSGEQTPVGPGQPCRRPNYRHTARSEAARVRPPPRPAPRPAPRRAPAAYVSWEADTSRPRLPASARRTPSRAPSTSAAPVGGHRKSNAGKVSRIFTVRNGYGFLNRKDSKEDVFVQPTVTQEALSRCRGWRDCGVCVGEKIAGAVNVQQSGIVLEAFPVAGDATQWPAEWPEWWEWGKEWRMEDAPQGQAAQRRPCRRPRCPPPCGDALGAIAVLQPSCAGRRNGGCCQPGTR